MTRDVGIGYFSFERLDAFVVAEQALTMALRERGRWRGVPGDLASQLERAMVSVAHNIAEGAGRESEADQRRHYVIARGSANEAAAGLAILRAYAVVEEELYLALRSRLLRVVQMLNRMIRR